MQINSKRDIPELLSPGGGMMQLRAAVENGADAVYIGGKLFNARINADNFDMVGINEALKYCHLKGVKLYVTLNTLLGDHQLEEALTYAGELFEMGVDALIIQDLGLGKMLKEIYPEIVLHLSTQGTVYNLEGVAKAKDLGYKRVVLARETTLEEIKAIEADTDIELEVFVHGALCICYSGQCEMSFEIGGRSGNRGSCGQPCRLPYEIYQEDGEDLELKINTSHLLSPKDLAAIKILDRIVESGVSSLKIEGRMKSPEYVAVVTRIYRKYLDHYKEGKKLQVEELDFEQLNQVFNRGGFTEGYYINEKPDNLITMDISKHQGVKIGEVIASDPGGLILVKLIKPLNLGDGVEIRNEHLPGNIVTFIQKKGKNIRNALAGEMVTIGDIKGPVNKGEAVYKITDQELMKETRKTYENKSSKDEKNLKKLGIKCYLDKLDENTLKLTVIDEEGTKVFAEESCLSAENHPISWERVEQQISKTGGTPFMVEECKLLFDSSINVSISKINQMRRDCLEKLESLKRDKGERKSFDAERILDVNNYLQTSIFPREKIEENVENMESFYVFSEEKLWEAINNINVGKNIIYVPVNIFLKNTEALAGLKSKADIVPVVGNVTKGKGDEYIRDNFTKIVECIKNHTMSRSIAIGNIGWIDSFLKSGLNVRGDFGLNACNSADFKFYAQMGLKGLMISHELAWENIADMNFHGIIPEIHYKGKSPVMFIESDIIGNAITDDKSGEYFLKDRKGELYKIHKDNHLDKTIIFNFKEKVAYNSTEEINIYSEIILRTYL